MSIADLIMGKKNATRWSRVKSTPKEEGGGDKFVSCRFAELQNHLTEAIMPYTDLKIKLFCALHHKAMPRGAVRKCNHYYMFINNNILNIW